jgi:hypothetical protein
MTAAAAEAEKVLQVGKYTTRGGRPAIVDAVVDQMLVGRIDIRECGTDVSVFVPQLWQLDGHCWPGSNSGNDIGVEVKPVIKRRYWLNIYDDGPGILRKTWEESLVEASREEKPVLCRVPINITSYLGDGLK